MKILKHSRNSIGESPIEIEGGFVWVDADAHSIYLSDYSGNSIEKVKCDLPVTAIAKSTNGGYLLATKTGIYKCNSGFSVSDFICDPAHGEKSISINDAVVSPHGDLWFGTMNHDDLYAPEGKVYVLKRHMGKTIEVDRGFSVTNGIAFSDNGTIAYVSNMFQRIIYRYELGEDGLPTNRQEFVRLSEEEGFPDGLKVDSAGQLLVSHWDAPFLSVYNLNGELVERITLPSKHVTRCAFVGENLDTLAVTTASYDCSENDILEYSATGQLILLPEWKNGIGDHPYRV